MPILKSSKKAARQNEVRNQRNTVRRRRLHDVLKDFFNVVKSADATKANDMLPNVYKTVDMTAKQNIIPKNRASRIKSKAQKAVSNIAK